MSKSWNNGMIPIQNLYNHPQLGCHPTYSKNQQHLLNKIIIDILRILEKMKLNINNQKKINIVFLTSGPSMSEIYIVNILLLIGFKIGTLYFHDINPLPFMIPVRLNRAVQKHLIENWKYIKTYENLHTNLNKTNLDNTLIIGIQYQYALFGEKKETNKQKEKNINNIIFLKNKTNNKNVYIYLAQNENTIFRFNKKFNKLIDNGWSNGIEI